MENLMLFPGKCGTCQRWETSHAYLSDGGRYCQNPKSESYGLRTQYGDACRHYMQQDGVSS